MAKINTSNKLQHSVSPELGQVVPMPTTATADQYGSNQAEQLESLRKVGLGIFSEWDKIQDDDARLKAQDLRNKANEFIMQDFADLKAEAQGDPDALEKLPQKMEEAAKKRFSKLGIGVKDRRLLYHLRESRKKSIQSYRDEAVVWASQELYKEQVRINDETDTSIVNDTIRHIDLFKNNYEYESGNAQFLEIDFDALRTQLAQNFYNTRGFEPSEQKLQELEKDVIIGTIAQTIESYTDDPNKLRDIVKLGEYAMKNNMLNGEQMGKLISFMEEKNNKLVAMEFLAQNTDENTTLNELVNMSKNLPEAIKEKVLELGEKNIITNQKLRDERSNIAYSDSIDWFIANPDKDLTDFKDTSLWNNMDRDDQRTVEGMFNKRETAFEKQEVEIILAQLYMGEIQYTPNQIRDLSQRYTYENWKKIYDANKTSTSSSEKKEKNENIKTMAILYSSKVGDNSYETYAYFYKKMVEAEKNGTLDAMLQTMTLPEEWVKTRLATLVDDEYKDGKSPVSISSVKNRTIWALRNVDNPEDIKENMDEVLGTVDIAQHLNTKNEKQLVENWTFWLDQESVKKHYIKHFEDKGGGLIIKDEGYKELVIRANEMMYVAMSGSDVNHKQLKDGNRPMDAKYFLDLALLEVIAEYENDPEGLKEIGIEIQTPSQKYEYDHRNKTAVKEQIEKENKRRIRESGATNLVIKQSKNALKNETGVDISRLKKIAIEMDLIGDTANKIVIGNNYIRDAIGATANKIFLVNSDFHEYLEIIVDYIRQNLDVKTFGANTGG